VIDLGKFGAGVYNVPVQLVAPSVVVHSLSPASVTLTVEKLDQKAFPVAMYYGGQANVVVSHATVTPSSVTVRGPADELAQVATVRIDMPLNASQSLLDSMIRPIAVNSAGEEIRDLQVVPNLVRVQAQFLPATGTGPATTHSP
jgi:YbbR domain-containing protein